MLTFPDFEEFVTQEELDVFDNGRYEEIVQMLSDLGYLTISAEEGKIVSIGKLQKAVYTFREEAISGSLISKSSLQMPFPKIPKEDHEDIVTYREFSVLQLLVSLDGDFTLQPISEIRKTGIYTRVLQYRLHLLGLLDNHPDGIFTDEINVALNQLAVWLSPLLPDELLDLTGNMSKLIFRIKGSKSFEKKIVYFNPVIIQDENSKQKWEAYRKNYSIVGQNSSFIKQLEMDIGRKNSDYKRLSNSRQVKIDNDFLKAECKDTFSYFIIRLSQIAQWISGYYLGTIDGKLGELTFDSFHQLAKNEVENGNVDFKLNLFVGYVSDDYWVVNPHYLLEEMTLAQTTPTGTISRVFSSFNAEYEQLDANEKETVDKNMRLAWKNINIGFSNDLKSTNYRFRRIYYGARSMLQSFLKGMKSIFKKLKDKIIELASGLFNLVKNFAKFLYREIREALHIFSRGLKFLTGNRELVTKDCFTKFFFDMDCVNYSPVPLTENIRKEHQQLNIATTTGLTFCLTLTGRIIHFAIIVSLGWHRLIIEAGIMLKQLVKESYSEKEYIGYFIDPQG